MQFQTLSVGMTIGHPEPSGTHILPLHAHARFPLHTATFRMGNAHPYKGQIQHALCPLHSLVIKPVLFPFPRVFFNILPYLVIILLVPYHMIVETGLPYRKTDLFGNYSL